VFLGEEMCQFCLFFSSRVHCLFRFIPFCIRTGSCKQFPPFVEHKGIVVAKHHPLQGESCPGVVLESSNIPHGHPYVRNQLARMHQRSDAVATALAATVSLGPSGRVSQGLLKVCSPGDHIAPPFRLARLAPFGS
jgi:hypothetical protein